MQAQRQRMRYRVAQRFARVPGQHGDGNVPMYYPMPVNPGMWGSPWAKVKDDYWKIMFVSLVALPTVSYCLMTNYVWFHQRIGIIGKRAWWYQKMLWHTDLDDPDFQLKWDNVQAEKKRGDSVVTWGGTNFIASYLWEPGDPEPDIRRRAAPEGHH